MLPERVRELWVHAGDERVGQLLKHSIYEFRYPRSEGPGGRVPPAVSLLMPPSRPTWQDGDLFPCMDQNLPEGDLFMRLRALFPKQPLSPMHLLALIGRNGIGRLGFGMPDAAPAPEPPPIDRRTLLNTTFTPRVFDELVRAYLSTGAGVAGMQPKIMVPDRATIPVPTLICKAASPAYPGLAANEFLCLSAAQRAGIETAVFDLSVDGQLLVVDRFDVLPDGTRLALEDIAALMGLRVRDVHSDRKYHGSYEAVAQLLRLVGADAASLTRFFEQLAFSVMVKNGDAHLKNFGVLYTHGGDVRLAPMFDVVTTSIYRYARYGGGPALEDRTLALKLFAGKSGSRVYPTTEELLRFGSVVCRVARPEQVIQRIAQGMREVLKAARRDARVPASLLDEMKAAWASGLMHAGSTQRAGG